MPIHKGQFEINHHHASNNKLDLHNICTVTMFTVDQRLFRCIHRQCFAETIAFPISQAYMIYPANLSFNGGNDCISEFERISTFHGK